MIVNGLVVVEVIVIVCVGIHVAVVLSVVVHVLDWDSVRVALCVLLGGFGVRVKLEKQA